MIRNRSKVKQCKNKNEFIYFCLFREAIIGIILNIICWKIIYLLKNNFLSVRKLKRYYFSEPLLVLRLINGIKKLDRFEIGVVLEKNKEK
jgi:hypothetical protein